MCTERQSFPFPLPCLTFLLFLVSLFLFLFLFLLLHLFLSFLLLLDSRVQLLQLALEERPVMGIADSESLEGGEWEEHNRSMRDIPYSGDWIPKPIDWVF